jgi:hypothetical protein
MLIEVSETAVAILTFVTSVTTIGTEWRNFDLCNAAGILLPAFSRGRDAAIW